MSKFMRDKIKKVANNKTQSKKLAKVTITETAQDFRTKTLVKIGTKGRLIANDGFYSTVSIKNEPFAVPKYREVTVLSYQVKDRFDDLTKK